MSSALAEIAIKRGERRLRHQNSRFLDSLYEIETWGECIRDADGFRQWHVSVNDESFCASIDAYQGAKVICFISLEFDVAKSRRVLVEPGGRMILECDGCPVYTENKYFDAARKLSEAIDRLPQ